MIIQGNAWVFGDHIDTDLIVSGEHLFSHPEEASRHVLKTVKPSFAQKVRPGDMIVAGKNFGCGSSREIAAEVFKHLGVGCVLARDFGRIFYRNCFAVGLPAFKVRDGLEGIHTGDELELDLNKGVLFVHKSERTVTLPKMDPVMAEFISAGGVKGMLSKLKGVQNVVR